MIVVKSFNLFKLRANIKWTHTISADSPFTHFYLLYLFQGTEIFEVYVSDVIGRRFEKVKNRHIFENWMPI
jgi:hypothetical protein